MQQGNNIIDKYKTWLRLEKSLSANSIEAYLTDLDKLIRFVESEGKDFATISYQDLQRFVAQLRDIGIHPRSQGMHHIRYKIVLPLSFTRRVYNSRPDGIVGIAQDRIEAPRSIDGQ